MHNYPLCKGRRLACSLLINTWKVMRFTALIILIATLQVSARTNAQKINLNVKQAPLREVFRSIKQQTGYSFFWNDQLLAGKPKISVHIREESDIRKVLDACLNGLPLSYTIDNRFIYIRPLNNQEKRRSPLPVQQQPAVIQQEITGQVTDTTGGPIAGASVVIEGTTKGTVTDSDGRYHLNAENGDVLVFSYVGYRTRRVKIDNDYVINVRLHGQVSSLDDIIMIGYGTQKRADLTGSVGTVDVAKTMVARPVTNVQELLAGAVPGLNVSKGSGAVGSGAALNIRGTSTIGGSSGVLVLIDGFPGNIYTVNPNDIESVSVLKDAASASIYGSRAANGVLLVTTKSGKRSGKPMVNINSSVGWQNPQIKLDFVGSADFMKLWDQALENDGKDPLYGEQGLKDLSAGKYADNKWYIDIYKKNSLITNHNVAVSGGNDAVVYRVSGSYDYQDGTLPNNNYKKFAFRPDLRVNLSDKVWVTANLQYTETFIMQPQSGTELWQSQASRAAPISPIYSKTGQFGVGSSMVGNPIAAVHEGGFNKSNYKELFGVIDLNYAPLKNWNIKGSFARYSMDQRVTDRVLPYDLYDDAGQVAKRQNIVPSIRETYNSNYRNTLQLTSDYSYAYREHHFKLLAGYSQEYYKTDGFNAYRDNLPFNAISVLDVGSQSNMQNGGSASDVAIQSVFGRLNYDYDNRYLLQMNLRSDGSSRFASGHRWGTFPSFSAGWNIHQEKFFHIPWISQLKLRGSWGVLGDAEKVGYYATAQVLTYNPGIYGFNGSVVPGAYNTVAIDPGITWERAKQTNVGLDLGLLQQKLAISVDYFYNQRDNILYAPPVPQEFGLGGPVRNLLKLDNKGWEFSADYKDRHGDFNWALGANLSVTQNKVKDLGGTGPWIGNAYTDVGTPLNVPYGLVAVGLFKDEADVKSLNQGPNVFPGNIKYLDLDGNDIIDGNDRRILNEKSPVHFGGNLSLGWKDLDLSVNIYGVFDNYRYISGYEGWAFFLTQNARPWALDNWTPQNPDATYPRLSIQYTSNDTKYSSYWLRKADYIKIQNAQLGYHLPSRLAQKYAISDCRFYFSVQNLATITKYPGFDPEGGWYPLSRTFSFGVNLKF